MFILIVLLARMDDDDDEGEDPDYNSEAEEEDEDDDEDNPMDIKDRMSELERQRSIQDSQVKLKINSLIKINSLFLGRRTSS
jgi:hypothetical protein